MKGLARLICLMTLVGVTACQDVTPTSRITDSLDVNSTTTESLPTSKSVDLDYSQEPEPKVTVSFNPVEIVVNLWRGVDRVVSSANRATDAVQSLAGEKAEAIEQAGDSAQDIETFGATDNSLSQADESYTYHNAQPDPNLPAVEAIPCDDPRIVSDPAQVCQFRPGVIRMPRLDK